MSIIKHVDLSYVLEQNVPISLVSPGSFRNSIVIERWESARVIMY